VAACALTASWDSVYGQQAMSFLANYNYY